jgi:hypothetical protein
MTPVRAGVVLAVICAICLVVVGLRAERVRLEARAEAQLGAMVETRRRIWNLQAELARLRAPEEVRRRAMRVAPGLGSGFEVIGAGEAGAQVADNRL